MHLCFKPLNEVFLYVNLFYYCGKFWFTPILYLMPTDNAILKWIKFFKPMIFKLLASQGREEGEDKGTGHTKFCNLPTVPTSHNTWLFNRGHPTVLTQPFQDQGCVRGRRAHRDITNNKTSQTLKWTESIKQFLPLVKINQTFVCSTLLAIWKRYVLSSINKNQKLTKSLSFIPSSTTEKNFSFSKQ